MNKFRHRAVSGPSYNRPSLFLLLLLFLAMLFLSSVPVQATAADTHHWLPSCVSGAWSDTLCWSHTTGGAPSAGVPTATNDVAFDSGGASPSFSGANAARDVISSVTSSISVGSGSSLVIHSWTTSAATTEISLFVGLDLSFSGSFSVTGPGHFSFLGTGGGLSRISYTGSNGAGLISGATIGGITAQGKAVYCSPGCVDGGDNVNILFTPCPVAVCTTPAPARSGGVCDLDSAIPGLSLTTLFVIFLGVGVLLAMLVFFGFFGGSSYVGQFTVRTLEPTRIVLGIIGAIAIFSVIATIIPEMTC